MSDHTRFIGITWFALLGILFAKLHDPCINSSLASLHIPSFTLRFQAVTIFIIIRNILDEQLFLYQRISGNNKQYCRCHHSSDKCWERTMIILIKSLLIFMNTDCKYRAIPVAEPHSDHPFRFQIETKNCHTLKVWASKLNYRHIMKLFIYDEHQLLPWHQKFLEKSNRSIENTIMYMMTRQLKIWSSISKLNMTLMHYWSI